MAAVLDQETLNSGSESWIPRGRSAAISSCPSSRPSWSRVTHTAVRQAQLPRRRRRRRQHAALHPHLRAVRRGGLRDGLRRRRRAASVSRRTIPAPPAGCETLADPLLQIFDLTGMAVLTQVAGHDVDYTLTHDASGNLGGSATADLDDNGLERDRAGPDQGQAQGKRRRGRLEALVLARERGHARQAEGQRRRRDLHPRRRARTARSAPPARSTASKIKEDVDDERVAAPGRAARLAARVRPRRRRRGEQRGADARGRAQLRAHGRQQVQPRVQRVEPEARRRTRRA